MVPMNHRAPLPPLPSLDNLSRSDRPVLAHVATELKQDRPEVAMYEDSPYIAHRVTTVHNDPAELKALNEELNDASHLQKYPFVAPEPDKLQAYIDAAITVPAIDPAALVNYNGVPTKIEDLPTAELRAMAGYGHFHPFHREVIQRTDGKQWPYTPNMCLLANNQTGVWVDPAHLACPGCGMDLT